METDPRESVRAMLRQRTGLDDETGRRVEVGIYNWAVADSSKNKIIKNWANDRFVRVYAAKARSVVANLDKDSYVGNRRLKTRLTDAEFPAHELAFLKPQNVHPERWREHLDFKFRRDEHIYEEKPAAMTDLYRCSKCRKKEVVYHEVQSRSADEPMSLFCTCLCCGHQWRMG